MATHQHAHPITDVIDPVCGMTISPDDAVGHVEHRGQTYYFCNESCLERFRANPDQFIRESSVAPVAAAPGATYICPMDPEVRQSEPGACPKCGMALEPDLSTTPAMRVEYTCPMHPEIVRDEPGACPICGMALEPRAIGLDEGPNPELVDMTRRFRIGAMLAAPIFLLAMSDMVLGPGLGGRIAMTWAKIGRASCRERVLRLV